MDSRAYLPSVVAVLAVLTIAIVAVGEIHEREKVLEVGLDSSDHLAIELHRC